MSVFAWYFACLGLGLLLLVLGCVSAPIMSGKTKKQWKLGGVIYLLFLTLFTQRTFFRTIEPLTSIDASLRQELPPGSSRAQAEAWLRRHKFSARYTEDKDDLISVSIRSSAVKRNQVKGFFWSNTKVASPTLLWGPDAYLDVKIFLDSKSRVIASDVVLFGDGS